MAKYKSPLDAIVGITEATTKVWTKQRKAEERNRNAIANRYVRLVHTTRVTIRDAAFRVMRQAYARASKNGTLPTNPRQIYYAARREILNATGKDELRSGYFLQTLLRDYMEEYDCSGWDIVWDARGHFTEPHTKRTVPIGTLQVREYIGDRQVLIGPAIEIDSSILYPTKGPENRYKNVLFIEKEGFDPLLKESRIAKRLDIAIMSTKGMSVSASRLLLDRLIDRGVERIFVLHDFDIAGFSIVGTLGTSSKVYRYRNKIPIVDLGLRLADVEELLAEPFSTDDDWEAVARTLARHGATADEITFLKGGNRVELNAMDSEEFVSFIERKLEEHGVAKVIPNNRVLLDHASRMVGKILTERELAKIQKDVELRVADTELPADLRELVKKEIDIEPALPWDAAVARIVEGLVDDPDDEEEDGDKP